MKAFLKCAVIFAVLQVISLRAQTVVTNIAAGGDQSFLLTSDGLWAAGANNQGQLGDGTYSTDYRFKHVRTNQIAKASTALDHTLIINSDGSLAAVGDDGSGDLGDGGSFATSQFEGIQVIPTGVIWIGTGNFHSMFVKKDGSLWGMGANSVGQLADGTLNNTNRPEQVVRGGVSSVACGGTSTFYITTNSALYAMGQLNGVAYNFNGGPPFRVAPTNVVALACGSQHAMWIKSDGSLWGVGLNRYGELGDGTTNSTSTPIEVVSSNVVAIACGGNFTLFIKADGSLWGMGVNDTGEMGDGTTNNAWSPGQIIASGVTAVAAGRLHGLFLKSDGSVWATGSDFIGERGNGFANTILTTPGQIFPLGQPVLTNGISNGTDLRFLATCPRGGTYYLLGSTNLNPSLSQWTHLATNVLTDSTSNTFSATLTNGVSGGMGATYYMLESDH
jgi:alpha-tubulin suppressor-like RCC1 family protein